MASPKRAKSLIYYVIFLTLHVLLQLSVIIRRLNTLTKDEIYDSLLIGLFGGIIIFLVLRSCLLADEIKALRKQLQLRASCSKSTK